MALETHLEDETIVKLIYTTLFEDKISNIKISYWVSLKCLFRYLPNYEIMNTTRADLNCFLLKYTTL